MTTKVMNAYTIDLANTHLTIIFLEKYSVKQITCKYRHNIFSVTVQDVKEYFFNWEFGFVNYRN